MSFKYIDQESFEGKNFSKNPLEKGEYTDCTFRHCDFSNANIAEIRFIETEFIDCNFSNANLRESNFQEVTFTNCKMLGLPFDQCNGFGFSASFENCQLDHSIFYQMNLGRTSFKESRMHGVDLAEADLKGAIIFNCF